MLQAKIDLHLHILYRSAQSRLGKTLRNLETMESKEQAQYRRQKQELLDSLDRLQGEQLKIRKVKQQYNKGLQKQTLGCSVPKYHTAINREKYGAIEYHNQVQGQDCSDGPQNIKAKHEQCADKPAITSLTVSLTGPKQRPSSSTAITNKSYEHSSNILRPLTPEIPSRLPNINVMDTCLTASSSCHDISHGKTEVINPKQNPVQRIQSDELMLKSDGKLQQDQANVNREQRSASFSQYGVHRRPNISREGICASPLATKSTIPSSSTGYSQKHFKAQSQNNSPLLPRRKLCRAKDWIPPEKEDLLAELEDYKLELQERVQHFLTTNNPQ